MDHIALVPTLCVGTRGIFSEISLNKTRFCLTGELEAPTLKAADQSLQRFLLISSTSLRNFLS
jgi:hypothetical protein